MTFYEGAGSQKCGKQWESGPLGLNLHSLSKLEFSEGLFTPRLAALCGVVRCCYFLRCALANARCLRSGDTHRTMQENDWDRFPMRLALSTRVGQKVKAATQLSVWKDLNSEQNLCFPQLHSWDCYVSRPVLCFFQETCFPHLPIGSREIQTCAKQPLIHCSHVMCGNPCERKCPRGKQRRSRNPDISTCARPTQTPYLSKKFSFDKIFKNCPGLCRHVKNFGGITLERQENGQYGKVSKMCLDLYRASVDLLSKWTNKGACQRQGHTCADSGGFLRWALRLWQHNKGITTLETNWNSWRIEIRQGLSGRISIHFNSHSFAQNRTNSSLVLMGLNEDNDDCCWSLCVQPHCLKIWQSDSFGRSFFLFPPVIPFCILSCKV